MFWSDLVPRPFDDLAAVLDGDPLRWLPTPVERTAPDTYRGQLRLLGRDVPVTYEVNVGDVAAHGYRCLQVTPGSTTLAPFQAEVSVLPADDLPGLVRLSMIGAPGRAIGAARAIAPLTSRLLFARLRERISARLVGEGSRPAI